MKKLIRTIAAAAILFTSPLAAQDSNDCVTHDWGKLTSLGDIGLRFTNNCQWDVDVHWVDNEFGRRICGRSLQKGIGIRSGDNYTTLLLGMKDVAKPLVVWCADASRRDHPDYNTCRQLRAKPISNAVDC
ncbi:MAG: hypothetical protein F4153_10525 [Acidimicrobiia bacterium]|nr:hypothetical protein [Acidimicrobiia bacterium]